jgi:hypothetical protein
MRHAMLVAFCLLGLSACYAEYRQPDTVYADVVTRDAVFPNGQRLLLQEDRRTARLTVVRPRELAGQVVVLDPDSPQGNVLVVRPVEGDGRRYVRVPRVPDRDWDHDADRR